MKVVLLATRDYRLAVRGIDGRPTAERRRSVAASEVRAWQSILAFSQAF